MRLRMKPFFVFATIQRMEEREDGLLVEGYCYVNEVVQPNGIRLKRSAMEAAAADYMRWGAVREMHQASAAGTATADGCGVTWDEKGCYLRALIVDKDAQEKCRAGVYKGFSVGVRPTVMRGKTVETCTWLENSLVDRPADPDAVFTIARAEGADLTAEFEVEELPEEETPPATPPADPAPIERAAAPTSFADLVPQAEADQLFYLAFDLLRVVLRRIQRTGGDNREELCRTSIQQFADYLVPVIVATPAPQEPIYYAATADLQRLLEREDLPELLRAAVEEIRDERASEAPEEVPDLARLQELTTENTDLLRRTLALTDQVGTLTSERDLARGEVDTVRAELTTAQNRVAELEKMPPAGDRPVVNPQALDRTFLTAQRTATDQASETLLAELKRLNEELPKEPDHEKRQQGAARINVLRMQLRGLGVTA